MDSYLDASDWSSEADDLPVLVVWAETETVLPPPAWCDLLGSQLSIVVTGAKPSGLSMRAPCPSWPSFGQELPSPGLMKPPEVVHSELRVAHLLGHQLLFPSHLGDQ